MIAEANILSSGPWNSDLMFSKDIGSSEFYRHHVDIDVDVGLNITSTDVSSSHSVSGSSQSPSAASSECGDDFAIDVGTIENNFFNWNDTDYLDTTLTNMLENNITDDINLANLDWVMSEDITTPGISDAGSDIIPSTPSSPQPVRKRSKPLDPFTCKAWTKMSMDEQMHVVESLTTIISTELGLREQLDVIRLIDPAAVISTTDTEFVIDVNCLTDSKWSSVREYVKKAKKQQLRLQHHAERIQATSHGHSSGSSSKRSNGSGNSEGSTSKSRSSNGYGSTGSNTKVRQSKKENREQKVQVKALKQRQKKEYKQMMKERRSGLFAREEVLSLQATVVPEEEEIDILE